MIGDRGALLSTMRFTTPASNAFDFDGTFAQWARGTVETLEEIRKVPVASLPSRPQ